MPAIFDTNTTEGRILLLLVEVYPITVKEISDYLNLPMKRLERSLDMLASKGIISLEPLPDSTYVSLISGDFSFKGKETDQMKSVREKLKKRQASEAVDESNGMYA